jgi:hypothetical protein
LVYNKHQNKNLIFHSSQIQCQNEKIINLHSHRIQKVKYSNS